jgi:hypothetical protein
VNVSLVMIHKKRFSFSLLTASLRYVIFLGFCNNNVRKYSVNYVHFITMFVFSTFSLSSRGVAMDTKDRQEETFHAEWVSVKSTIHSQDEFSFEQWHNTVLSNDLRIRYIPTHPPSKADEAYSNGLHAWFYAYEYQNYPKKKIYENKVFSFFREAIDLQKHSQAECMIGHYYLKHKMNNEARIWFTKAFYSIPSAREALNKLNEEKLVR